MRVITIKNKNDTPGNTNSDINKIKTIKDII
jgi:hypothetical protein